MAYQSTPGTEDDETILLIYGTRRSIITKGDPRKNDYIHNHRHTEKVKMILERRAIRYGISQEE